MKKSWWKLACIALLLYTVIGGFLLPVPRLNILNETIRNLHFHVPMWFAMVIVLGASCFYSILYLKNGKENNDFKAVESANMGIIFGVFGLITGAIWAKFTWGEWWSNDPKQNAAAIGMFIYLAYFILRGSLEDENQKARISAVYNIFAFSALIPLLFILPRLTDSLHPGNGGNPGFNAYDLDSNLRLVFYPAVLGWTLLGVWIIELRYRLRKISKQIED